MRVHAKGKIAAKQWAVPEHDVFGWNLVQGGFLLPLSNIEEGPCDDSEANARRLVACWNACEGISTESLETEVSAAMGWTRTASKLIAMTTQRNELLEALQGFVEHGTCFDREDMRKARAAIAKATGKAP
jgi:hypothetical protein